MNLLFRRENLVQYARELNVDMSRLEQALNSMRGKEIIDADIAQAKTLRVTGPPGFFINGRFLSGAKPFDEFAKVINAELTRLKIPVPTVGS